MARRNEMSEPMRSHPAKLSFPFLMTTLGFQENRLRAGESLLFRPQELNHGEIAPSRGCLRNGIPVRPALSKPETSSRDRVRPTAGFSESNSL
jgi:hypothetical protein